MESEYETPLQGTDHEYLELTNSCGYESVIVTSSSRDSHYEQLQPISSQEYTSLNGSTTATSTARDNTAPPDYEPGLVNNIALQLLVVSNAKKEFAYNVLYELRVNKANCKCDLRTIGVTASD